MNLSVKNIHFAKWLNRKIGPKKLFTKEFSWDTREIHRWTSGHNFPKAAILSALLYDLHLFTKQEYTSLVAECMDALLRDYKEFKYETSRNREHTK